MRLFGKVDSTIDRYDGAEWLIPPFDLSLASGAADTDQNVFGRPGRAAETRYPRLGRSEDVYAGRPGRSDDTYERQGSIQDPAP